MEYVEASSARQRPCFNNGPNERILVLCFNWTFPSREALSSTTLVTTCYVNVSKWTAGVWANPQAETEREKSEDGVQLVEDRMPEEGGNAMEIH